MHRRKKLGFFRGNLFEITAKYADVVSLAATERHLAGLPDGLFA